MSEIPKCDPEQEVDQSKRACVKKLAALAALASGVTAPAMAIANSAKKPEEPKEAWEIVAEQDETFRSVIAELEPDNRPGAKELLTALKEYYPQIPELTRKSAVNRYEYFFAMFNEIKHQEKNDKDGEGRDRWTLKRPNFQFDRADDGVSGVSKILQWYMLNKTLLATRKFPHAIPVIKEKYIDDTVRFLNKK